ncbi:hypothetical protein PILCRDRAFT_812964 [Piloderma croceum F 1598]|uniref:Large ribosomal subunit protein uL29m n=1 Tax=Piloderma croceum (strain F 1598) TaxID=765440 RepID=A0A0C3GEK1_PILCF|nr:hypothetical protein PILCRDRAFT_812964 [Piloderma croceum F 1598]
MFSLLRVPLAPRTLLTVTHIRPHIRSFASEIPPDDSSQVPALISKKPTPNHEHDAEKEPEHELEHEHEVKAEPHSQPQPQLESQQRVPEEDPAPSEYQYDENHEDYRPLLPPHGIKIDKEGHGLSRFYRKFRQTNLEGEVWEWALVEAKDHEKGHSGRSWSAPELRRKSFQDLHILWYVLLRERNLLATQKEELRKLGVTDLRGYTNVPWKMSQCRKSMARIKSVINERRLAYEGGVARFAKDKTLGKIGAEAEQEAAKAKEKKPKGKKVAKPAVASLVQGKSKGRKQGRKNPSSKKIPPPPADAAPIAPPAP